MDVQGSICVDRPLHEGWLSTCREWADGKFNSLIFHYHCIKGSPARVRQPSRSPDILRADWNPRWDPSSGSVHEIELVWSASATTGTDNTENNRFSRRSYSQNSIHEHLKILTCWGHFIISLFLENLSGFGYALPSLSNLKQKHWQVRIIQSGWQSWNSGKCTIKDGERHKRWLRSLVIDPFKVALW